MLASRTIEARLYNHCASVHRTESCNRWIADGGGAVGVAVCMSALTPAASCDRTYTCGAVPHALRLALHWRGQLDTITSIFTLNFKMSVPSYCTQLLDKRHPFAPRVLQQPLIAEPMPLCHLTQLRLAHRVAISLRR